MIMASRCAFENSNEVGVFAALTNAYCLTGTFCFWMFVVLLAKGDASLTCARAPTPPINRHWWIGELLFRISSRIARSHSSHSRHYWRESIRRSHDRGQPTRIIGPEYHHGHGVATFTKFITRRGGCTTD